MRSTASAMVAAMTFRNSKSIVSFGRIVEGMSRHSTVCIGTVPIDDAHTALDYKVNLPILSSSAFECETPDAR